MAYLPYEEPGITTILSLASFIILLNAVRYVLDHLLYCGIIGEILIGIIWGLPVGGTAWLTLGMQGTIQALGYLGLIGLVFEGGLSTDLAMLRKSVYMSISIATIGLLMPIGLSFILLLLPFSSSSGTAYPTPLAGFSAGASLCSTSLGTTFAILSSAGMQRTRVGVVLVGAAMMDDIVGLVMVNIVTTLGDGGVGGWPIARPIVASFGLLLVSLAVCNFAFRPLWVWVLEFVQHRTPSVPTTDKSNFRRRLAQGVNSVPHNGFLISTAVLIAYVTIASFIDASILFAAFIAGGVVNQLWKLQSPEDESMAGPSVMYDKYYKSIMDYVLVPFFFASIGFSIPIKDMFHGSTVWKGIVYSILMTVGKGLVSLVIYFDYFKENWNLKSFSTRLRRVSHSTRRRNVSIPLQNISSSPATNQPSVQANSTPPHAIAILVGFAMVARGEIGFLIASLSQSSGTLKLHDRNGFTISSGEDLFLVIVWAVVICTIAGPIGVGVIIRSLRSRNRQYLGWI